MEYHLREVMFDIWCPKCEHRNVLETEDPCNECLNYPANEDSTKPVKFKEREDYKK